MLNKYETIVILDERRNEDGGKVFIESFQEFIKELEGITLETEEMGLRQLAHPINKKSSGYYWDVIIELPPNKVLEVKEKFRLDQSVLRLEIFSYDRPEKEVKTEQSKKEEIKAN